VGSAKDGNPGKSRPQTTDTEPADAVDDAVDVFLSFHTIPQWLGSLLGGVKSYQHCNAVFCYRMGGFDASKGCPSGYKGC
jgi:hypothetical protein